MSVRKTIAYNTAFNAAGRLWDAVATLILTRYIVEWVGDAGYGLWGVTGAFTGYVALLDVGIASSFVKYIAEHAAREERNAIASVVSTGFVFYLALGVILVAVGWPCIDIVVKLFHWLDLLRVEHLDEARFLFRGALLLFVATNLMAAFTSVLTGLQRMDLTNMLSLGASLVKIAATVWFLQTGHGLPGLLYANALASGAFAVGSVILAYRLVPTLRLSFASMNRATFAKLFAFGWRAQVSRLSNLIMFETDLVVAGALSKQLSLVGLFKLGVELANKMRQIPVLLVSALVPAASDLDARKEHERLARLYLVSSKYVAAVAVPLVLFTVGSADLLMRTWMGPGRETAAWVLRIIAFGYVANTVPGAGVSVVLGKGRADLQMKAGLIATAANVGFTVALVFAIGFWGIPIATALSMFISWAWFARAVKPVIGVGPGEMLRVSMVWPTVASLPGFVLCGAFDWWTRSMPQFAPFIVCGPLLLCAAGVFGALYLVIIRFTPFLDAFDHVFLQETLGLGRIPVLRAWLKAMRHA